MTGVKVEVPQMSLMSLDVDVPSAPVVATERLLWIGPLTVLTSTVAVHVIRLAALTRVRVPEGSPMSVSLGWIAPTADTTILCSLAVIVYAIIASFSDDPLRTFQRVAAGALLVSILPILIMAPRGMNGNVTVVVTLMLMHIAAYVPCVTMLPRLTSARPLEIAS